MAWERRQRGRRPASQWEALAAIYPTKGDDHLRGGLTFALLTQLGDTFFSGQSRSVEGLCSKSYCWILWTTPRRRSRSFEMFMERT